MDTQEPARRSAGTVIAMRRAPLLTSAAVALALAAAACGEAGTVDTSFSPVVSRVESSLTPTTLEPITTTTTTAPPPLPPEVFRLGSKGLFGYASAQLTKEFEKLLTFYVEGLRQSNYIGPLLVVAYADGSGGEAGNRTLSNRRAQAVAGWLGSQEGGSLPNDILPHGVGESCAQAEVKEARLRAVIIVPASNSSEVTEDDAYFCEILNRAPQGDGSFTMDPP
jgi:outer membrane protein OmpA-like peptidoglycan-associated protein